MDTRAARNHAAFQHCRFVTADCYQGDDQQQNEDDDECCALVRIWLAGGLHRGRFLSMIVA